ncbi:MAG: hypothetical protein L3J47_11195 [Sulfurovum sp.]|nr:hypothetical protein [Sulfurovum sp.]
MKKWIMLLVSGLAVVALSGCGGGGAAYDEGYTDGYDDGFYDGARVPGESMTTLFLVDVDNFSLGGVPYYCVDPSGAVSADYVTAPNGEFSFYPGERCTFDLLGFDGTPDDPLFIQDDIGFGKSDIPYACDGGDNGMTNIDGNFDYLPDDICTFYL